MGARTRIFKENILSDYKTLLSKDHKSEKQLQLFEFFCARLARSVSYQYKVRSLKESQKIHHSTIKKSIERFIEDGIFIVKDLGQQEGFSIRYNPEILEAELDESFNPYSVDKTNRLQSKIHWLEYGDFIGREQELISIKQELKKRKPIMLLGDSGVGKTSLLQKIYYDFSQNQNIIYGNFGGNPFKEFLVSIAYSLFTQHRNLQMLYYKDSGLDPMECGWPDIKKHVKAMKISDLVNVIIKSVEGKDYIIMIDHFEKITPTQKSYLNTLMDYCCVIGAAWDLKSNKHIKDIWYRFEMIKIKPLNKEQSIEFIEHYYKKMRVKTTHPKEYKKRVLSITSGSPSAIVNCLKKHSHEDLVDKQAIREIQSPQSVREFDMSFVFFFVIAAVVASRFLALGVGNRTLYVLAGVSGALFQVFRLFLFKTKGSKAQSVES